MAERNLKHFARDTFLVLTLGTIACSGAEKLDQNRRETQAPTPLATRTFDLTPTIPRIETSPTPTPPTETPSTPEPIPSSTPRANPTATPAPQLIPTPERTTNISTQEFSRGNLERREIALTFDCGASGEPTPAILEALRSEGVKVTFFITGKWALTYPHLTQQIAAEHEIANHSFTHGDFSGLTNAQIIEEMQKTEGIIMSLTGKSTKPYWRAPFGSRDARIMQAVAQAGWPSHVFWTVEQTNQGYITGDSGDWRDITPQQVKQNILTAANLGSGVITVSHCGSTLTPLTLKDTLIDLKAKGLKITTVSDILRP